jgi:hypothetical protein
MNVKLTLYHFKELLKNGFTLDMVFLLKLVEEGHDLKDACNGDPKLEILAQGIYRKGLISGDNKITLTGKNVLKFLKEEAPKDKIIKKKPATEDFQRWWKAFPGTDTFKHKDKSFSGSRSLRRDVENCRLKFNAILSEGEYTADDLVAAVEFDVLQKKENSYKSGENKLKYMQNSLTYLTQRSFEPFIELVKQGITIEEKPKPVGTTDI